eukprot:TRINITY_DN32238_c0_g1_i1.p1 TRINITY_DN32238_c0_g1~~TRINITY_DN32238_c0_g1_i1.p1  ORF type:complete len:610 (+),score=127.75 TRINITY_DN32238_c0_g1_i1:67-1896(+)
MLAPAGNVVSNQMRSTALVSSLATQSPPLIGAEPKLQRSAESSNDRTSSKALLVGSASAVVGLAAAALARSSRRLQRQSQRIPQRGSASPAPSTEDLAGPTNAIEEWLMTLELPTPLKPAVGSSQWASFAASLVQMFVVAGLSALGTLLEQGAPQEFYAQKYPEWSGIILALGFDHMYSCPLFLVLLVWLAASLIACTGTTQIPLAKKAQKLNFRSSSRMKLRGNFLVRVNCPFAKEEEEAASSADAAEEQAPSPEAQRRLQDIRAEMLRRGFVVRVDDENSPKELAGARGLVGKFAPMVVHLALLLCLAGNTVGLVFGASSEIMIGDGGYADMGKVLDAGRRAKGPLYDFLSPTKGLMDATNVKVEDFRIDYRDDGEIEQYYSKLVLEDARSQEQLYSDQIFVNKPLRYGGATIYQADWSIDRLQVYVNGVALVVPCKQVPGDSRSWGAFLPIELVQAKDPSKVQKISRPREGIVFVMSNMRNVQVYGSDGNLAGVLRSPNAKDVEKMAGMPLQFGEEITVEGSTKLRLDKIVGATGLIVKNDPGVPLVYLGYALLMPATLLSILPFGQVWAAVNKDDPNQVLVSGRSNRNQVAFEEEMQAMVLAATS